MTTPNPPARAQQIFTRWRASFLGEFLRRSDGLDLGVTALALGAQEVLCTAPLLVSLSALMMHFHLGYVGGFLTDVLGLTRAASGHVNDLFRPSKWPGTPSMLFGLATTAVFYVAVASTTQRCVEGVWSHSADALANLRRRVLWVCVQVPGFALAMYLGRFFHTLHLPHWMANVIYALTFGVAVTLFHWWGHHMFLRGSVSWRDLLPGSLAIGLGTATLTIVSPLFMPTQINENTESYGLIGAAFVLSLWAVSYSAIVVYGTLFGKVWVDRHRRQHAPSVFTYVP